MPVVRIHVVFVPPCRYRVRRCNNLVYLFRLRMVYPIVLPIPCLFLSFLHCNVPGILGLLLHEMYISFVFVIRSVCIPYRHHLHFRFSFQFPGLMPFVLTVFPLPWLPVCRRVFVGVRPFGLLTVLSVCLAHLGFQEFLPPPLGRGIIART